MTRLLSLDEKDAVSSLLSVHSHRKRLLDRDCPESSDSVSQCGSSSPCRDIFKAVENGTSDESFQFEHIIEFDPSSRDRIMRKPAIKKKMVCECSAIILVRTEWKHKQSNKHIQFMLRKRTQQQQQQGQAVPPQERNSLPILLQPQQPPKQKQNRYRGSPPPVCENPLSQQQLQPHPSLWSDDRTGSLVLQHDNHFPVASIFTEGYSPNPQPPAWNGFGSSGHIDLGQQSIFRSSDVTGTGSLQGLYTTGIGQTQGLAPQHDNSQARLQSHPLWYIAAPMGSSLEQPKWQWQRYRSPMAPNNGFFDRDNSAALSNFPICSFY